MSDDKKEPPVLKIATLDVPPNELLACIEEMRKNLHPLREYQRLQSKIIWARYKALKEEGFTDIQAIRLCEGSF